MPSVHVAWAALVALALIVASSSRWRWWILAHPILTVVAITATAIHWWLDGIVATAILFAVFEFWSEDFFSHVTARVNPDAVGTDVRGQELEWWTEVKNAFPDMTFSVDLLVECGDIIVSNWTVKGTHTGAALYDVPPSGEPVEINGTGILRMRDGKVVEHWGGPHCQQGLGLIR